MRSISENDIAGSSKNIEAQETAARILRALPLFLCRKGQKKMVTETFRMDISAVGSDDGINTYEIRRKWAEKGKKALVIELYPTLTADQCGNMDVSTMHLMNHVQELGWGEVRIVNLYSKVFSEKPTVSQLSEDDNNLSYIEEILEEQDIGGYDIVIAWGNTLISHRQTIQAKTDLLTMIKEKGLAKQVKCIVTNNLKANGVHPLYLGLRYSKDVWSLQPFPLEKVLNELESTEKKASARSSKKASEEEKEAVSMENSEEISVVRKETASAENDEAVSGDSKVTVPAANGEKLWATGKRLFLRRLIKQLLTEIQRRFPLTAVRKPLQKPAKRERG